MPVCDICGESMSFSNGYALTTKQVTTNEGYWSSTINRHGITDDSLFTSFISQMTVQRSGWLVCQSCIALFDVNTNEARQYAARQADPPGSGALNVSDMMDAIEAASLAWERRYGRRPSL